MKQYFIIILFFSSVCANEVTHKKSATFNKKPKQEKTVLIAILARNKAHFLPKYLNCIKNLDYNKKAITIYINTNNNEDETEKILRDWAKENEPFYKEIVFESHETQDMPVSTPHDWPKRRLKILGEIRNKSLRKTLECKCDYYFVADCDNYILPCTLKHLIKKDKPIIAPLLRTIPHDNSSNYFAVVDEYGNYRTNHDQELQIKREQIGTFKVAVVHCTYLVNAKYISKLNYVDNTNDMEFAIFSKTARKNNVDQYICNEEDFGVIINGWRFSSTLEEEKQKVEELGEVA